MSKTKTTSLFWCSLGRRKTNRHAEIQCLPTSYDLVNKFVFCKFMPILFPSITTNTLIVWTLYLLTKSSTIQIDLYIFYYLYISRGICTFFITYAFQDGFVHFLLLILSNNIVAYLYISNILLWTCRNTELISAHLLRREQMLYDLSSHIKLPRRNFWQLFIYFAICFRALFGMDNNHNMLNYKTRCLIYDF